MAALNAGGASEGSARILLVDDERSVQTLLTYPLRKVVDITDIETGTVRLKRSVDKADEMALDTASTKTTRVRP